MAEPCFIKANDAKSAVCMVAIIQGLQDYLSGIRTKYAERTQVILDNEARIAEETLRVVRKLKPGLKLQYDVTGKKREFSPFWLFHTILTFS